MSTIATGTLYASDKAEELLEIHARDLNRRYDLGQWTPADQAVPWLRYSDPLAVAAQRRTDVARLLHGTPKALKL